VAEDAPVVDDVGAVCHHQRFPHVVIGHQNADAGLFQIVDDALQFEHLDRIDARKRFIEQ
jgi:hypothetical protein